MTPFGDYLFHGALHLPLAFCALPLRFLLLPLELLGGAGHVLHIRLGFALEFDRNAPMTLAPGSEMLCSSCER